jgi:signal peptidase I
MPVFKSIYTILIDLVETLVIAAAIFIVIYAFLFRPFQVNGQSMFPNYHNGEYILTNLIALKFGDLKRGEVVVFESPIDKEKDYIKRVIGVKGDRVMIKDGSVYINGVKLDESSYLPLDVKTYGGAFLGEGEEAVVPAGEYFVIGDNRGGSSDSRAWGFVPKSKMIGKSFFVYWPINKARIVKTGKYSN